MRAIEFLTEARKRMYQYIKSIVPTWPDYIIKDWLYPGFSRYNDKTKRELLIMLNREGLNRNTQWQLVPNMKFTMDIWTSHTLKKLQGRAGGLSDMGMDIPRDAERHATQARLAQQQGGIRSEPVILIKRPDGYELLEGWHRTIQHFHKFPDGYTGPAYIAVAQPRSGVAEGKLVESAVFLNPTTVIVGQQHGRPLKLSPNTLKQIQAIAAKHGAWYEGNGTDRGYTKGQIDRYVGSWDDEVAKTANSNDPKWIYVLFANVDENNRVQRVGIDPNNTIFNRLLDTAKDNSYQGIGYTSQALQKFLQMASEGKYDFLKMSQQPATQENLTRFLKAGEALMWPRNWKQYPNKAGKIAKAATVDVRDQYLATRKAGVYVTGSGHLKAVQNITGKQGVAEDN
jgi:phage gp37-like protein